METLDDYVKCLILEGVERDCISKDYDNYSSDITQRLIMWGNYLDGRCPADALRGRVHSQIVGNQIKRHSGELSRLEKNMGRCAIFSSAFFCNVLINAFIGPSLFSIAIPGLLSYIFVLGTIKYSIDYKKKSKEKDDEYTALSSLPKEQFVGYIENVRNDVEKIIVKYK